MKKDVAVIFGLFVIIIGLLVFGKGFTSAGLLTQNQATSGTQPTGVQQQKSVNVTIKGLSVESAVAASPAERKKGLSNRESIPISAGMIFVFEQPGPYAIWMKNMKFAIDIIWIDESKKIVDIATNVAPEPGKSDKDLTKYMPKSSSKYVLEVNAGLVDLHDIQIGDTVSFQI